MCLPYLTSFCGLMSVKTGTFFIALFNQFLAVFGFVGYISGATLVLKWASSEIRVFIIITTVFGILVTASHVIMASVLLKGLRKEKSAYLRWYLIVAPGIITFHVMFVGGMAFLVHWHTAISSTIIIVTQIYFLLVIRSAYKLMLAEEMTCAAAARSNM